MSNNYGRFIDISDDSESDARPSALRGSKPANQHLQNRLAKPSSSLGSSSAGRPQTAGSLPKQHGSASRGNSLRISAGPGSAADPWVIDGDDLDQPAPRISPATSRNAGSRKTSIGNLSPAPRAAGPKDVNIGDKSVQTATRTPYFVGRKTPIGPNFPNSGPSAATMKSASPQIAQHSPSTLLVSPRVKLSYSASPGSRSDSRPKSSQPSKPMQAATTGVSRNSPLAPPSQRSVPIIDKCNRCREDQEDCNGARPMCHSCRRQGLKCVYEYDNDDRLNDIIAQSYSKYTKVPSNTPSEIPEYDYSSQDGRPVSSTSDGDVSLIVDEKGEDRPAQHNQPEAPTIEDTLFGYLSDEDLPMDQTLPSDEPGNSGVALNISEFDRLLLDAQQQMEALQETSVKAALRSGKSFSKTEPGAQTSTLNWSPFALLPAIKGPREAGLLTKAKSGNKWEPLFSPISVTESSVVSLPRAKSIGRLGPLLLSRNTRIGTYHHYTQEDEVQPDESLAAKYREVRERYHDYQSISVSLSGQKACAETVDVWARFVPKLLRQFNLSSADVVYYYLQDPTETEILLRESQMSAEAVRDALAEQTVRCETCGISPQIDLRGRHVALSPDCASRSAEIIARAALAAHSFQSHSHISLWHVVSLNVSEVNLVSTDEMLDKEEVEQICLACGLHACSVHGAFVEDWQLKGYQSPDTGKDDPVRINDAEKNKNERWNYSTWATPLRDDQHVCGAWCEDGESIAGLRDFRGRHADGTINGWINSKANNFSTKLADTQLCSDDCFWDIGNRTENLPHLTAADQEVFNAAIKTVSASQRGPCMMREWLPQHSCRELFSLMVSRIRQIPHLHVPPVSKSAKARLNSKLDLSMNHQVAERKPFFPCDHEGPCTAERECECAIQKIACEGRCKCPGGCERRFRGCNCHMTPGQVCGDKHCACWNAGRECDPGLCKGCGVDTVLHQAYKYKPEMRVGRCQNNKIQLDLPARTIKAPSEVQGYGLFAGQDLKKGDFIHEYKGEVVSQSESDRRGAMYSLSGQEYLFNLNSEQQIDANNFGNKSRFMNNSKKEANINVYGHTVLCSGQHRVGLFAKRDIKAGEELLYNYEYPAAVADQFWERGEKSASCKARIDTPVVARTSRGTRGQAKRKKSKKTRARGRQEESQGSTRGRGQRGSRKRGGLQSDRSRASLRADAEDFNMLDVDEMAQEMNERAESLDSDFDGEVEEESESESESESSEEVPESDADTSAEEMMTTTTPVARRGGSRGRGRGGRGRGRK